MNMLTLLYNSETVFPPQADIPSLETTFFFFKSQLLHYLVQNWQQKDHELGNIFFHALLDTSLGDVMSPKEKCGSVYEPGCRWALVSRYAVLSSDPLSRLPTQARK